MPILSAGARPTSRAFCAALGRMSDRSAGTTAVNEASNLSTPRNLEVDVHRLAVVLAASVVVLPVLGCGPGDDQAGQISAPDGSSSALPAPLEHLIGDWAIELSPATESEPDGRDGLVAFTVTVSGPAASVAQHDCYMFSDLVTVSGDQLRAMSAQLEQTPVECDTGPTTANAEIIIECLQKGCEIVSISDDEVELRGELPTYLARLPGNG